jgi:hypothetical protein
MRKIWPFVLAISVLAKAQSATGDMRWHRYGPGYRFSVERMHRIDLLAIVEPIARIEEDPRHVLGREQLFTIERFRVMDGVGASRGEIVEAVIFRERDGKGGKKKYEPFESERYILAGIRQLNGKLELYSVSPLYGGKPTTPVYIDARSEREIVGVELAATSRSRLAPGKDIVARLLRSEAEAFASNPWTQFDTLRRLECEATAKIEGVPASKWLTTELLPIIKGQAPAFYFYGLQVAWRVSGSAERLLEEALRLDATEEGQRKLSPLEYLDAAWAELDTETLVSAATKASDGCLVRFCIRSITTRPTIEQKDRLMKLFESGSSNVHTVLLYALATLYEMPDKKPSLEWSDAATRMNMELMQFWRSYKG